jgi:hypothetical protein
MQPNTFQSIGRVSEGCYQRLTVRSGLDHILTKKTSKRASPDVGFIFIAYNLERINIIGIDKLLETITQFYFSWTDNAYKTLHQALFTCLQSPKPTFYQKLKISHNTSFFATFTKKNKIAVGF